MTDEPKPQADKFRDLARELECDEDEAAFEDKVRRVAKSGNYDGSKDLGEGEKLSDGES